MNSLTRYLLVTVLVATVTTPGRAVTLVEKGKARAVIILRREAVAGRCWCRSCLAGAHPRDVRSRVDDPHEDKISGDATEEQAWISCWRRQAHGRSSASPARVGAGRIVLSAKGHVLALFGTDARTPADPHGTRYASQHFWRTKLGVRYLWPGELGKVVPRRETIVVEDFEHRFTPPLAQRRIRSMGYHDRLQVGLDNLGFKKDDYERLRAEAQRTQVESP